MNNRHPQRSSSAVAAEPSSPVAPTTATRMVVPSGLMRSSLRSRSRLETRRHPGCREPRGDSSVPAKRRRLAARPQVPEQRPLRQKRVTDGGPARWARDLISADDGSPRGSHGRAGIASCHTSRPVTVIHTGDILCSRVRWPEPDHCPTSDLGHGACARPAAHDCAVRQTTGFSGRGL